jgi:arylsulfatase A-like enzyme
MPCATRMARRALPRLLALAVGSISLSSCTGPQRPNILIVVIDTLRADRLGFQGGRRGLTPFMDSLAARGVAFQNAYATSSWTNPSIASLLTSRHQSQHGVVSFTSVVAEEEVTLPERLKAAGYKTGGFSANALLGRSYGFGQGYDVYETIPLRDPDFANHLRQPARAEEINAKALAWLDSLPAEGRDPVYLYVHYMEPHTPYAPRDAAVRRVFQGRPAPDPDQVTTLAFFGNYLDLDARMLANVEGMYDAEVMSVDQGLHALFDDLERRRFLDQALIVITADHAEEFLEHQRIGHGKTLYEEVIRIPLLVLAPGRVAPADAADVVSLLDIAPTLLDWIGEKIPAQFEGRSFRGDLVSRRDAWFAPLLRRDSAEKNPGPAFSELLRNEEGEANRMSPHLRAVVSNSRKLIAHVDGGREFFDLALDPHESGSPELGQADRDVLERLLEDFVTAQPSADERPTPPAIDSETRERMRALGYE